MHDGNDDPSNRNPYKISLRSKAEADIVNDAKRKRQMQARYEGEEVALAEAAASAAFSSDDDDACGSNAAAAVSPSMCDTAQLSYSINRLRGLRTLDLTGCTRLTDVWLRYSFRLPELRSLSLANCQQISAWGVERLVRRGCPSLEHVDLSDCHNVSDKAVQLLAIHLRRLTQLRLERCAMLTDHSLDHLAVHCERLRELNVRGCRSMCSEPAMRLVSLRSLRVCEQSKPGPYLDVYAKRPESSTLMLHQQQAPVPPPPMQRW